MLRFSIAIAIMLCTSLSFSQTNSSPVLQDTIYFNFDESQLDDQAKEALSTLVNTLQGQKVSVDIQAFTDNVGSEVYNQSLSSKRAQAVEQYIKAAQIDLSQFSVNAYGENKPLADNNTENGRKKNRCAIVSVYQEQMQEEFTSKGVDLPDVLEGVLKDPETGNPVKGEIIVHTSTGADTIQTDENGKYTLARPDSQEVTIDVFVPGYFYQSMKIKEDESIKAIALEKAETGKKAKISNLHFLAGEAMLVEDSKPELEKFLRFMKENTDISIEIGGHVSGFGDSQAGTFLYRLAERRAKMVYDYLVENGINAERMTHKGYSDWQMIVKEPTIESEHHQNRRVEIMVTEQKIRD
jgi:outer membrane protein OmpA-like peptidoglycan-associated protein